MARNLAIVFSALFILTSFVACDSGEDADLTSGHVPADIPEEAGAEAAAGSAGSNSGTPCAPVGSTLECDDECVGGVQECLKDKTLGPCVCPDGGSAGSSGSGGSAGSSGSGGSAGEAGSGGTGGSSGQAGSGGSAGSAGSGGGAGSSGSGGSAGAGGAPFSVECDQYGIPGQVVVYMNAPVITDHVLSMGGWINFPNWMGPTADTAGGNWCKGLANKNKLVCQPELDNGDIAEIVDGTTLIMWPGLASTGTAPDSYFCEETSCPVGTFVVCKGKSEVCGSRAGVLTGNMGYVDAPWVNLSCLVD